MRQLLFTHNTNISNGLKMLSGEYKNLRCCEDDGRPIGLGIQFRHGLDSQYGEIKFIMKKNFEKNKKGIQVLPNMNVKKINEPFYFDFYRGKGYKDEELKEKLNEEYQRSTTRPSKRPVDKYKSKLPRKTKKLLTRTVDKIIKIDNKIVEARNYSQQCQMMKEILEDDQHYEEIRRVIGPELDNINVDDFMDLCKLLQDDKIYEMSPYGIPCQSESEKKYSWCNIQLHLGENVPFTDVLVVILPRYLLNIDDIVQIDGMPLSEFLKRLNESKIWKDKMNPFYHKLLFVGTKDYSKYYNYIYSELLNENPYYTSLRMKNQKDMMSGKKVKDLTLSQDYRKALKQGTRAAYMGSSQLSSTRGQFNKEMKLYMDIVNHFQDN